MKKSLSLIALMAAYLLPTAGAATYSDLSTAICDSENHVIYNGQGRFTVQSGAETCLELNINLSSLNNYVNSNDYRSGQPLMLWDDDAVDYGLADSADTAKPTGEREPSLCFYWAGNVWRPDIKADYATLQRYAQDGTLKLKIVNSQSSGVTVYAVQAGGTESVILRGEGLKSSKIRQTEGYQVNVNYITSVTLHTPSQLDTQGYEPPADYTALFETKREDGSSLKRVMFMGDSITHGVNDQTWRWQLFKILVDNGIEAEIVGPREGYTPGYSKVTNGDAGDAYAGITFPNVHLAQSSGRTHNIIVGSNEGMTGVNYGGHSTKTASATYNCDTWCCLMGTNDLLSDNGYTTEAFATKMQNLLGGEVSSNKGRYIRKANDDWGNMGQIAMDVLHEPSDVLYVMSVPCWGSHHNNNQPERHLAVKDYNSLLRTWVAQFGKKFDKKLVYVNVNEGMVDFTHRVPFSWPDSMSNKPGRDGLHPNEQGSLIIAGNLAKAMHLGGRTAGLPRAAATEEWQTRPGKRIGTMRNGNKMLIAKDDLHAGSKGYSVEIRAAFGNGNKNGWMDNHKALRFEIADGTRSGMLNLSEGCIMWGDMVLYCTKTSAPEAPLRVVWHGGNEADNVPAGYYVWLGDMLIGQGLPASNAAGLSGIRITADGADARIHSVRWTYEPLAPATEGITHEETAFKCIPAVTQ